MKRVLLFILVAALAIGASSCTTGKLDLKVTARIDGKPAAQAKVTVDGADIGVTDKEGVVTASFEKRYDSEVVVTVTAADVPGHRFKPWKNAFVMKKELSGTPEPYSVVAEIESVRFVTIMATSRNKPVSDAAVKVDGREAGKTDAQGAFVYEYKEQPESGWEFSVVKSGFAPWKRKGTVEPGLKMEAALVRRLVVTVRALREEFGDAVGINGADVNINDTSVGRTDAKGGLTWTFDGDLGTAKIPVVLTVAGHIPDVWRTTIAPEGSVTIDRYFHPVTPQPIRVSIYKFIGNTPGVDLTEIAGQTEAAVASQLAKHSCFRELPADALQKEMKRAKLTIEKMTTKGWRETQLRKSVDLIVLGSVAKDDNGLLIETKFYNPGGILIMSQIGRAKSAADINAAARDIVNTVVARFPFEGTVVGEDGERYRINLGKAGYGIAKGTDFIIMNPRLDDAGKVASLREIGRVRVKKLGDNGSWAEVEELRKGEQITVGDRVVRRVYHEGEEEGGSNTAVLTVKGGVQPDVSPLAGVNIYKNNQWFGATGPDGKAEIPVPLNKSFTLVLYRHGYQQLTEKVSIEQNKEAREFVLTVNNAILRIDSEPRGADVAVDGEKLGRTPLLDGKAVTLGFHTIKVSLGDDYRDWEEVVEFARKEENLTGDRKIVLSKDHLRIGERAEQRGDIDGAIQAYRSTVKGGPDYAEARHRLAQLYLDEKQDYDGAIREFEVVLSSPENQQLVYKQFAVAFMNLGHAYYEKGSSLTVRDKEAAARNLGKAVQNLQTAKLNTRFFPAIRYDEALHDTYYYTALAYHKLYLLTKKSSVLTSANLAWQEYFDFFPRNLEGKPAFEQARDSAKKYWDQIQHL